MRARWPFVIALGAAIVLFALSRTLRGQIIAADVVGGTVDEFKKLLVGEEGLRLTVYKDTGGVWTVAYGHKILAGDGLYPYTDKKVITQAEAEAFFKKDTAEATSAVDSSVKVLTTSNMYNAMRSLAYNIGSGAFRKSTLVIKLNNGDKIGAANEFSRWIYDNGVVNPVLVARRDRERTLFLTV